MNESLQPRQRRVIVGELGPAPVRRSGASQLTGGDEKNSQDVPQRVVENEQISKTAPLSSPSTGSKAQPEAAKQKPQAPSKTTRTTSENSSELIPLPVFDNQLQCAAITGIPLGVLKAAKKKGCKAFKHSRVELAPLLKFLFSDENGQSAGAWKDMLDEAKAKREMLRLARDEGKVIERGEVEASLAGGMALVFGEMDQAFTLNLPSQLKGLTEPEIMSRLAALSEQLKQKLKDKLQENVNKTEPPTSQEKK